MISNEGYIPVHQLYDEAFGKALEEAEFYIDKVTNTPFQLFARRPEDVILDWFEDFYEQFIYISNGIDPPSRLSKWAIKHRFYGNIFHLDYPDLFNKISATKLKDKFRLADPFPSFWLEGPKEGQEAPTEEEWLEFKDKVIQGSFGGARVPLLINQNTWTIDLSLFRFLLESEVSITRILDDETIEHANFLRKFDGYSLCVPEQYYQDKWQKYWEGIAARNISKLQSMDLEFNLNEAQSSIGRPRKREAVASKFRELFPNGRQGYSWKQVLQAIEQESGISVSIDTLKRGLKS